MMDICLTINGKDYRINTGTIPPELTLNTFIRQHAELTGTKFMCLEGGCGACVVTVKRDNPLTNQPETIAVNSCLQPVHVCNGYRVTTIEALGNRFEGYHPLQISLTSVHGSQCGYCTSGMIMNMYALLEQPPTDAGPLTMADVEQSFGGNMCRCTGYRSILEAFRTFAGDASPTMRPQCPAATTSGKTVDIEDLPPPCGDRATHCTDLGQRIRSHAYAGPPVATWQLVTTLPALLAALGRLADDETYQLVVGNTARGVQAPSTPVRRFIGIAGVAELHSCTQTADALTLGAAVTLSTAIRILRRSARLPGFEYCARLAAHYELIANVPVRNVGSLAGNLCHKHQHPDFPSDVFVTMDTVDARLTVLDAAGAPTDLSPVAFLAHSMRGCLLYAIRLPRIDAAVHALRTYKTMIRAQNAHAYVNAGMLVRFSDERGGRVRAARLCFGGIRPQFTHANQTERLLTAGADATDLYTDTALMAALRSLDAELDPDWRLPDAQPAYRKRLAQALFYRFVLDTCRPAERVRPANRSGAAPAIFRPLSAGVQDFQTVRANWPLTEPVTKYEGLQQASGEARYIGDMPVLRGELWAALVLADRVHCRVARIDAAAALAVPGVRHFYAASDIPGKNSFTPTTIYTPFVEPVLLAVGAEVPFNGQPIGIVLADTDELAARAAALVRITYVVTSEGWAVASLVRSVLSPWLSSGGSRPIRPTVHSLPMADMIASADRTSAAAAAALVVSGRFELAGQYHYHMETQTAVCVPDEERARSLNVFCSTQWADFTQRAIAEMLAIPQNHVQMVVRRLGGAFGAKISRATLVGCAAALGSFLSRRPVRLRMSLETNMRVVGKRFGLIGDYRVEVEPGTGRVQKCECTYVQDAGSSMNESVLDSTTQTFSNCYETAGWKVTGTMVATDAPSNTFCRSPGTLEGIAMGENMMEHIAAVSGLPPMQVRLANMRADHPMRPLIGEFMTAVEFESRRAECDRFNAANRWRKRGLAVVPMQWPLIYYGVIPAYVAIYHGDGSVVVTHGGIECGQGINTKVAQVVAYTLSVPLAVVEVRPLDTVTAANAVVTGSSCTSEMACYAAKRACDAILARMQPVRSTMAAGYTWPDLVAACYTKQIDLRETYQFKEADVANYDIYGVCACETEVDVLTGCYQLRRVDLWEDVGESMSPLVDIGQVEGAFVMGIGYWCSEQLVYDRNDGRLLTDRTWTYKPPGALDIPVDFRIKFIQKSPNPIVGVLRSKAVGEPAICMSVVIVFALRYAIKSARKDAGCTDLWFPLGSANTPEQVFMHCNNNINAFTM